LASADNHPAAATRVAAASGLEIVRASLKGVFTTLLQLTSGAGEAVQRSLVVSRKGYAWSFECTAFPHSARLCVERLTFLLRHKLMTSLSFASSKQDSRWTQKCMSRLLVLGAQCEPLRYNRPCTVEDNRRLEDCYPIFNVLRLA
jgi:hypothetical protein